MYHLVGNRIIGGYRVMKERPWIAKLSIEGYTCGGSIINKRFGYPAKYIQINIFNISNPLHHLFLTLSAH